MSKEEMIAAAKRERQEYQVNLDQNGAMLQRMKIGEQITNGTLKNLAYKSPEFVDYYVSYYKANLPNIDLINKNFNEVSKIIAVLDKIINETSISSDEFAVLQNSRDPDTVRFTVQYKDLIAFSEAAEEEEEERFGLSL